MNEVENLISSFNGYLDEKTIKELKETSSRLTGDELTDYLERSKRSLQFSLNIKVAQDGQQKSWNSIRQITSHNSVLINIHNGTSETFSLTHSSWDNSEFSLPTYDIAPTGYATFILRGEPPQLHGSAKQRKSSTLVKHDFTYRGGEYAFNFSTSQFLHLPYNAFSFETKYTPKREHSYRSIGKSNLFCHTNVKHQQDTYPYNYAIEVYFTPI